MRRRLEVLVVDDDFADRKIIRRTIAEKALNVNVVEATSVDDGLEKLREQRFDVILLDYKMPNVNGIEMVQRLRARAGLGSVAIVMMSASESEELAVACLEAGAQDFILKSELQKLNLERAIVHAQKRFELEHKLHQNYLDVKHIAEKDPLTGLSNRHHFNQLMSVLIPKDGSASGDIALVLLDLDNFKFINDTLGHDAGDRLLIEFSTRIKNQLRRHEGFARLGGDEFAVILTGIKTAEQAAMVAQRIHTALLAPIALGETELSCNASVGAAMYPLHAKTKEDLVKFADVAMYAAKRAGKGQIRVYDEMMHKDFSRQYDIQVGLKQHLQDAAFGMHFQPVVELHSGKQIGYEALLRWPDIAQHFVPDEFIPVAEKNNDIHAIGEWVINHAIAQLATWQKRIDFDQFIAINISPIQLQSEKVTDYIIERAEYYHVKPENIVLEITETALFEHHQIIKRSIESLSAYGFKISLDDFGVGYSSISHLINYPINIVKLDKSLFKMDESEEKRLSIFEALAGMLKRLNMTVVAEGIESEEQFKFCQRLNIDHGQGYFFAEPVAAQQIESTWLESA
ncbi:EAL domain-containing protein [Glaciecola sp. XM2]|uniref:putative bifunctional diguanylate cyclase/phosphodiesterase n=1 Tax=Glaciecola sp. XM2 TaxID=1914931 RepID=UPI001BDECC92|nr:EAL domain-containing protein [Glaciecola sp. XM2]MBT1449957.1 EAL domain-containing protein [Glaciecola sp. XM2]